jgi:iron complex transport system permease protein
MNSKNLLLFIFVLILMSFLLVYGETGLNLNSTLVWQLRLPKVIVCLLAGGMLAISGLLMQIFFQNPLAGPDTLGVSSGSSLFVAFWMMASVGFTQTITDWGMSVMSFVGALAVFCLLLFFIHKKMSRISLIITGLLISSFTSSGISVLVNMSQTLQVKNYLAWSMGSFRNVTLGEMPKFIALSLVSIVPVLFFVKSINQYLLSESYAKSMGVNILRTRILFITIAAMQISVVTLFCGPIGFIGIISPHLARLILKKSQLKILFPAVFFIGAILALITELFIVLTLGLSLPVNAILGLIGAPVIVMYLYHQKEWSV